MMLNGYPKSFIEKEIKKTLQKMENTPNNSNKEKTEGIAKLFLPYERGYGEKIKRIAKNMALKWFSQEDKLWNRNSQHPEERN